MGFLSFWLAGGGTGSLPGERSIVMLSFKAFGASVAVLDLLFDFFVCSMEFCSAMLQLSMIDSSSKVGQKDGSVRWPSSKSDDAGDVGLSSLSLSYVGRASVTPVNRTPVNWFFFFPKK